VQKVCLPLILSEDEQASAVGASGAQPAGTELYAPTKCV